MRGSSPTPPAGPFLGFQLKHIGDFLMTLPALGFLKQQFPADPVGLVVPPALADLARRHPWVDEVFTVDRRGGAGHLWRAARAIGRSAYRTGFIFDGQTRSIVTATLARLQSRVGAPALYPLGGFAPLYTRAVEIREPHWRLEPQARRTQKAVAAALGLLPGPVRRPPPPELDQDSLAAAGELAAGLSGSGPLVGLALQGRQPEKSWPLAEFARLARQLWDRFQARLFVTGGPDESPMARALARAAGAPVADFCGRTTLPALIALADLSDLFITVDTGTSHLAALTETPIISIFIWTSPAQWPPQSPHARLLVYEWALKRFGLNPGDGPWRAAAVIGPDLVFEEAAAILDRAGHQE